MATITWNAAFEAVPAGSASLSDGDDAIRNFKTAIRERVGLEHYGLPAESSTLHGLHRQGSGISYYQDTEPTLRPDGVTSLSDYDKGRLWFDSSTNLFYIYKGTTLGWVGIISQTIRINLSGALYVEDDIISPIIFPLAFKIVSVFSKLSVAPTGTNDLRFDLKKNGSNSIFTAGYEELGDTLVHEISDDADLTEYITFASGDYLTVDISQVGSTIGGSDLSIVLLGVNV